MAELADDIAAAERHIAEARQILAVHLDRIKQLLDAGADVGDAESRLQVFARYPTERDRQAPGNLVGASQVLLQQNPARAKNFATATLEMYRWLANPANLRLP